MLAIQNQLSVLTKILETKVQQQQIVEYQQAVSASLNKVSSPQLSRSRKPSSNQDGNLINNNKNKSATSNSSIDKGNEVHLNVVNENSCKNIVENDLNSERTGCVVS